MTSLPARVEVRLSVEVAVLVAVCELMGIETGVDVFRIQDVAEDRVVPIMDFPIRIDRDALTLGYAGVYGSFLLFAKRAEQKYGVPECSTISSTTV